MTGMDINSTLLCIHRDPAQLSLLKDSGYELVTATNAPDGLRLFMSRPVDAVVLEHHLSLLDGSVLATEIKRVRPKIPIVMLVDHLELPDGALQSVDAIVAKSDGAHFLWATVHFILNVKPVQLHVQTQRAQTPAHLRPPRRSREDADSGRTNTPTLPN
jgi:CheY-like chemotaxis protein